MTLLKNLMNERADALEAPVLDLDAITAAGDRRVTHRRGFAGLAAAAVVAGIAIPVGLGLGNDAVQDEPPVTVSESAALTWASGSVIHAGSDSVDVGREVHLFVTVDGGYVLADPSRAVQVWDGTALTSVGQLAETTTEFGRELVSDGHLAAWLTGGPGSYAYVVVDTRTGETQRFALPGSNQPSGEFEGPEVAAVDGNDLYVRDQRGAVRIDVLTGETTVLREAPARGILVIEDVENGEVLFTLSSPAPGEDADQGDGTYLSDDLMQPGQPTGVRKGDISPSGSYVMSENSATSSDDFTVVEAATGRELSPVWEKDYMFFLGYAWIDDDSYTAFGIPKSVQQGDSEEFDYDLLTCEVGGECTKAATGHWPATQLPVGQHISN